MKQHTDEEILFRDGNGRYYLFDPEVPLHQMMKITHKDALDVCFNCQWITECVGGDGEDYWLFVYIEPIFIEPLPCVSLTHLT